MCAVFKLENHFSTCAVLVLVPMFHMVVVPFLSALWLWRDREREALHDCSALCAARSEPLI
jgi:hypothetical protein